MGGKIVSRRLVAEDIGKLVNLFSREDEEKQAATTAKKFGMPYINLVGFPIEPDDLQIIPEELAKKYRVVSYQKLNNQIRIATENPENPGLMQFLKQMATTTNQDFIPTVCSPTSLEYALKNYEFIAPPPPTLDKLVVSQDVLTTAQGQLTTLSGIAAKIRSVTTSQLLEMIFGGAINIGASDVHIEPAEKEVRLRYRIDGVLQDIVGLPTEVYRQAANRIKYLSQMHLDNQKSAQDGRFDIRVGDKPIDVRVSAIPGAWGEVFVMRLLDQSATQLTLEDLGFSEHIIKAVAEATSKPHGVVLNTGPTGSGKTTTLYAILEKLNSSQVKIITIEDPIEYRMPGVDQTQVKADSGYTFASALKSVLRQDPDIIMIGEIRDQETGEIAMQAAMTGHLVISTLHTNSAPSSLPRLLDMGVPAFLLSGSINLIMAQRLVRKLCTNCKGTKIDPKTNAACVVCSGIGYKGRTTIGEFIKITPAIEQLIKAGGSVSDYEAAARKDGYISMYEDGLNKVKAGITSLDEVKRVSG